MVCFNAEMVTVVYKMITYGAKFRARKQIAAIETLMDRGKLRATVKRFLADPELQKPRSTAEKLKIRWMPT